MSRNFFLLALSFTEENNHYVCTYLSVTTPPSTISVRYSDTKWPHIILLPLDCLFSNLRRLTSKERSMLRITGPLWRESIGDRWIPLTNGQWYGMCFLTSSCHTCAHLSVPGTPPVLVYNPSSSFYTQTNPRADTSRTETTSELHCYPQSSCSSRDYPGETKTADPGSHRDGRIWHCWCRWPLLLEWWVLGHKIGRYFLGAPKCKNRETVSFLMWTVCLITFKHNDQVSTFKCSKRKSTRRDFKRVYYHINSWWAKATYTKLRSPQVFKGPVIVYTDQI